MTILDHYPSVEKPERFGKGIFEDDEIKLFPPIATESQELVGYMRTGGCTAGCGACCEALVVPISREGLAHKDFKGVDYGQIVLPIDPHTRGKVGGDDWERWITLHEVWMYQSPGGLLTVDVPIKAKSEAPTEFDAWMTWLEGHGITFLQRHGQTLLAYLNIACTKLENGRCTVLGTLERPDMCSPYPQHPLDVEGIDFCTYKFQPVKREQAIPLLVGHTPPQAKPKRKKHKNKKGKKGRKR